MIVAPGNDILLKVSAKMYDTSTKKYVDLTTGTATAIIAKTKDMAAVVVGSLTTTPTYSGTKGDWFVAYDAAVLTEAALMGVDGFEEGDAGYIIVTIGNAFRRAVPFTFSESIEELAEELE